MKIKFIYVMLPLFILISGGVGASKTMFEIRMMTASKTESINRMLSKLKLNEDEYEVKTFTSKGKTLHMLVSSPFATRALAKQALESGRYPKDAYIAARKITSQNSVQSAEKQTSTLNSKTVQTQKLTAEDSTYLRLIQVLGAARATHNAQLQKIAAMREHAKSNQPVMPEDIMNCLEKRMSTKGFSHAFLPLYKNYFTLAQAGEIIFFSGIKEDPTNHDSLSKLKSKIDGYLSEDIKAQLQQRMSVLSARYIQSIMVQCHANRTNAN